MPKFNLSANMSVDVTAEIEADTKKDAINYFLDNIHNESFIVDSCFQKENKITDNDIEGIYIRYVSDLRETDSQE